MRFSFKLSERVGNGLERVRLRQERSLIETVPIVLERLTRKINLRTQAHKSTPCSLLPKQINTRYRLAS